MNTKAAPKASTADDIRRVVRRVEAMLIEKNAQYGDSALNPVRIFSRADPAEQIKCRIDDKLSRIARGSALDDEDVVLDLAGYCILLLIARDRAGRAG